MKFNVFLPSLLVSPDWIIDSAPPRLPAIETLLARGRTHIAEEWPIPLLNAFGAGDAIAALTALGDAIEPQAAGWMFAEPAHFQAGRGTIRLISASHLQISANESKQLIDALNTNFADRGLAFFCGASGHWYVRCPMSELPKTTAISAAKRGNVAEEQPQSNGSLSWEAIQNEAQMLLHSHTVNTEREAAGRLTINGVWFWGEGVLPEKPISYGNSIGSVFGDMVLGCGLAKWCGARFANLAELNIIEAASLVDYEHHAVLIDLLTAHHEKRDSLGWLQAALTLDTRIFAPLLASLRNGLVDEVVVTLPRDRDTLVVTINAQSLGGIAGWWRNITQNSRPVSDYFNA